MAQSLEDIVEWTGEVRLEENRKVINVLPRVKLDPRGGFLISDVKEDQVRLYSQTGKIRHVLGESGRGPGEFQYPTSAIRLTGGRLLVAGLTGKLSLFDSTGTFLRSVRVPVHAVMDMHELPDGTVLMAGASRGEAPGEKVYLLHRVNLKRGKILDSFFAMPTLDPRHQAALISLANLVAFDVRNQEIVAAFSLKPVLHFFDVNGEELDRTELSLQQFNSMTPPRSTSVMTRAGISEWYATFSLIESIHWIEDGILLQYYDHADPQARDLKWTVSLVDRAGGRVFERPDSPQLLTLNPETSTLYFVHPESETPERWAVGTLAEE